MKKRALIISLLVCIAMVGIFIIKLKTIKTPNNEINKARKMLLNAEMIKSSKFATHDYLKAIQYYDSAMQLWGIENEKLIIFRNFQKITAFAIKSSENSIKAIDNSKKNISKTEDLLDVRINTIKKRITGFEKNMGSFPINSEHHKEISNCKMKYSEGILAFKNKNYLLCKSKLDSVEITIDRVFKIYEDKLNTYLNEHAKWKEMEEQTILYSRKNKTYTIVVDKLARECTLYKNGKVLAKHNIEMGANWIGDKNQQGDKSTPEGIYKIIDKKSNGQTRFYKALLLNYPNEEDKKRFLQNKKNGVIKPNAKIGNLIEIHGDGGKGVDWTDGCIALSDADMDELFRLCPKGTRVAILGSTKSLNEISIK